MEPTSHNRHKQMEIETVSISDSSSTSEPSSPVPQDHLNAIENIHPDPQSDISSMSSIAIPRPPTQPQQIPPQRHPVRNISESKLEHPPQSQPTPVQRSAFTDLNSQFLVTECPGTLRPISYLPRLNEHTNVTLSYRVILNTADLQQVSYGEIFLIPATLPPTRFDMIRTHPTVIFPQSHNLSSAPPHQQTVRSITQLYPSIANSRQIRHPPTNYLHDNTFCHLMVSIPHSATPSNRALTPQNHGPVDTFRTPSIIHVFNQTRHPWAFPERQQTPQPLPQDRHHHNLQQP